MVIKETMSVLDFWKLSTSEQIEYEKKHIRSGEKLIKKLPDTLNELEYFAS